MTLKLKRSAVHRDSEQSTASTCSISTSSYSDNSSVGSQYEEFISKIQRELEEDLRQDRAQQARQQAQQQAQQEHENDDDHAAHLSLSSVPQFVSHQQGSCAADCSKSSALLDELASDQDVLDLLTKIRQALEHNDVQQRDLQEKTEARFDMACARVLDGCPVSAKMATRRMHRVRVELGRVSAVQCQLMELYSTVFDEWTRARYTVQAGHAFMVDVNVAQCLDTLATLQDRVQAWTAIVRTDEEMLAEVQHICAQEKLQKPHADDEQEE